MSDRFPGKISIGGTLCPAAHKPKNIDVFLGECSDQPIDWGDDGPDEPLTLATIGGSVDPNTGWLTFRDDQACYGEFETLEELCLKLDLSFDRHSDARYEYDGELVRWRPSMTKPLSQLARQDGALTVDCERIEKCLAMLDAGDIEDGIEALRELVPEVAPLPKFTVDTSGA